MVETVIAVEIAYARPEQQHVIALSLPLATTVEQAIRRSGILNVCPEIDLQQTKVGIFSKRVRLDDRLQSGDRVEIYRSLLLDPKQRRRKRAANKIKD